MKTTSLNRLLTLALILLLAFGKTAADASVAYGSINNFDTVNDTGKECHGFEIEIEDCRSTDISYTYNYNHYGVPKITQDDSVPAHPKCTIRWESKQNADGSWAAYTAIPSGPIAPTNGHMFTNPNINFGGEHFGVGYQIAVGAVRYQWLVDNGSGQLVHGGAVQVSTPTFTYYPPVVGNPAPAQVQAVIAPPPPPAPEPKEFGKAVWVKEIRTTTHNNNEVRLRDLVSDDPDDVNDKNWKNGEPDEVEAEWEILQKDYHKADGGPNNALPAAAEALPNGDEVVTRRYEFYKYVGPLDAETGEAQAQGVGPDGVHGDGIKIINGVEVDLSTVVVVGDFTGSQMVAVAVDAPVALIDHVSEGEVNIPYAARTVVIEGTFPFMSIREGDLPPGMEFDEVTGILSGTPTVSGAFQFTVTASDTINPDVSKTYTLLIAAAGEALAPANLVDTTVLPLGSGTTTGSGAYAPGSNVTVVATPNAGYHFVQWIDNGQVVSDVASHTFVAEINHSLVAEFAPDTVQTTITTSANPDEGGSTSGGGVFDSGSAVSVVATANPGFTFLYWTEAGVQVSALSPYPFTATADRVLVAHFAPTGSHNIALAASPVAGGTVSGGGSFAPGTNVTVVATANDGYLFLRWSEGGAEVSNNRSYSFTATASRSLTAVFQVNTGSSTPAVPDEYTVSDITNWSPAQLASLPYFDRYVPLPPAGASADFIALSRNGFGIVTGYRTSAMATANGSGAYVRNGVTTSVGAWGAYTWAGGVIQHSSVTDVALSGLIIGTGNLSGSGANEDGYIDHAFLLDPESGLKTDITPDALRADARSINDYDMVVGNWTGSDGAHGFLRYPDGTLEDFTGLGAAAINPAIVTNRGLVAGSYSDALVERPFVCESGLVIVDLGLPTQGGIDSGIVVDANDHGLIVGRSFTAAAPLETTATRWYRSGNEWVAEDLNSINATGGFVLDSCVAVNDAGYIIATGHLDGSAGFGDRILLLTPDKVPAPSVVTLEATELMPTSATLRVKVNACTKTSTVSFHLGLSAAYGEIRVATPGTVSGTAPAVCTVQLTGLLPHTTYHFRGSAVSSKGTTHGDDFVFTTPHNLTSWTASAFAGIGPDEAAATAPDGDYDHDGESNLEEYAFGHDPRAGGDSTSTPLMMEPDGICLTYERPTTHSGIAYTVEVATNVAGPWNSGAGYTETVSTIVHGATATVKARSLLSPVTSPQQFLRVRVTLLL